MCTHIVTKSKVCLDVEKEKTSPILSDMHRTCNLEMIDRFFSFHLLETRQLFCHREGTFTCRLFVSLLTFAQHLLPLKLLALK